MNLSIKIEKGTPYRGAPSQRRQSLMPGTNITPRLSGFRRGKNERPEHLVFGIRSIARRDAYFCDTAFEHIGPMRRGIAPAGKGFGQSMIAGGDIFDRDRRGISG